MRILQVVTKRQHRGAEVFASILAADLAARGHEVAYLGIYAPPPEALGVNGALNADISSRNPIVILFRLCRFIFRFRPHVIQCNGSDTLKYTWLASWFVPGPPPIVYRNISIISHWINTPFKKLGYVLMFLRVRMVVSVSDASREDFVKHTKKRQTEVVTIKNIITIKRGIDLPQTIDREGARPAFAYRYPVIGDKLILLHVGAMTEEKNHAGLLRIFALVQRQVPNTVLFCLGSGPEQGHIERQLHEMQLSGCVVLAGYHADPSSFYLAADLLILPSHIEGIPGVVLEAAAFQTPSVAYDVGGMKEAIVHGTTGVIVPHGQEAQLADAAVQLLRDVPARLAMGLAAREFVKANYSREVTVQNFENLYRSLVGKSE